MKKFDFLLTGMCLSRALSGLIMTAYAAALAVLMEDWSMSAARSGSIASGFHLGSTVSLVGVSWLADRLGPKRLYLGLMILSGLFSLSFALMARDYYSGLILHTLLGLALGGTYTTGLMIIADQYKPEKRGRAMGLFVASTSLGYAFSLIVSGLALPLGGYKLSFLLCGLGPVLGAVISWYILSGVAVSRPERLSTQGFSGEVLRNKPAMLLIGGYTFHNFELLGMWAWTPAFITACFIATGSDELMAAGFSSYLNAAFHLTGLIASSSMGIMSDRLGRARVIVTMAAISATCSFVFGWTMGWPVYFIVVMGLIYAFSGLGDSPVLSAGLSEAVPPAYLGSALGLRSLLGFGVGAISSIAFGAVLDTFGRESEGWGMAYSLLGLSGLGAVVVGIMFARSQMGASGKKGS
jgi:MFS family permease